MPALADLLADSERERLAALASPADMDGLADAARQAAADSTGVGRLAWHAVTAALDHSASPSEAAGILAGMVTDTRLRVLALACLGTFRPDTISETT